MFKRILLVDDEKDIVQMMRRKIQAAGYEVSIAYNGKEALEISAQEHPHLIFTDVVMPVMDGLAFCHELKNRQDISHIPVIVATAHGSMEETFRGLGVQDFVLKPFQGDDLLDKVRNFFNDKKAVKVLLATKMLFLMKSIINESLEFIENIDLQMSNSSNTIIQDANTLKPDLLVLDVDMFIIPSADEVVGELRKSPQLKDTTILLTRSMLGDLAAMAGSRHSAKSIDDCLGKGANHFIGSLNKTSFLTVLQDYCR